ncbi:MAG: RsmB/NOP family class I SAM-dependent RNA methyltransferase [Polyangiaceae bacterium]
MVRVVVPCTEAEAAAVKPLVVRAYSEARARQWPFLSDVLDGVLRGAAEEDRAVAAGAVQAMVKYDRLLAFAAGSETPEARYDALFALASGQTDVGPRIDRVEKATERLGLAYSLPDWIVDLVRSEVGEAALEAMLARVNEVPPRVARVNTLRTTRDACIAALEKEGVQAAPAQHAAGSIVLGGRRSPFRTQAFARGDFEMQDEASQLVAELVAPAPRSFVVDACAGAGGKTLALAALLAGKGKLLALDSSETKLEELRRRARRAGASNVQARAVDLRDGSAVAKLDQGASRVLVDAPCTGMGALRRNPEARWRLRESDLSRLVATQAALLSAAATLVGPHGRLVFATCSFLPSEGEVAVEFFLSGHPDFTLVTARDVLGRARSEPVASRDGKYLRTWRFDGHADGGDEGMDGFFAAVLRRARA